MIEIKDINVFTYTENCFLPLNLKSLSGQTLLKFACQHFGRHQHQHRVAPMRKSKSKPQLPDIKIITKSKSNSKSTIFAVVETVFFIRKSLPRCTICHGAPRHGLHLQHGLCPPPLFPLLSLFVCSAMTKCAVVRNINWLCPPSINDQKAKAD